MLTLFVNLSRVVEFRTKQDAQNALRQLDQSVLDGRKLYLKEVSAARKNLQLTVCRMSRILRATSSHLFKARKTSSESRCMDVLPTIKPEDSATAMTTFRSEVAEITIHEVTGLVAAVGLFRLVAAAASEDPLKLTIIAPRGIIHPRRIAAKMRRSD